MGGGMNRAEEAVRALASAAAAIRLYPPASELPAQAARRAVDAIAGLTGSSSARLAIEPKVFKIGDETIGEGNPQVSGLAEALYAHQVGQLIVAPGLSVDEVTSFLQCVSSDPASIRESGGIRAALVAAGITHLAVIELTLRASLDSDLTSIDLASAPIDVVGTAVVRAAADWVRSGAAGDGHDSVTEAIDGLEPATRELASARIVEALSHLDEKTRSAVLTAALRKDVGGHVMSGLLAVVAGMKPASLARLLRLAAARAGVDPISLLDRLPLGAREERAVRLILRPNPRSEADSGVPPRVDARAMAEQATDEDDDAQRSLRVRIASSTPQQAAGRALGTAVALATRRLDAGTLEALGDALGPALAAGAFAQVAAALRFAPAASEDPALEAATMQFKRPLSDPEVLARACETIATVHDAELAAPVLANCGATGAEALLAAWQDALGAHKTALESVLQADVAQVLPVAGRRLRVVEVGEGRALVEFLAGLKDRRAASAIAQALENQSAEVRASGVEALASLDGDDAIRLLVSAMYRPDEATARVAMRATARARVEAAVPALVAQLGIRPPRSWEYKREVVDCLKELRAQEAIPALEREARRFALSAKRRAVRQAARAALDAIRSPGADRE
jgi:hypothetical protein